MVDEDYDKVLEDMHNTLMSNGVDIHDALGVALSLVLDLMIASERCCLSVPAYSDDKSWAIQISSHDGHCEELDRQLQGGEYVH